MYALTLIIVTTSTAYSLLGTSKHLQFARFQSRRTSSCLHSNQQYSFNYENEILSAEEELQKKLGDKDIDIDEKQTYFSEEDTSVYDKRPEDFSVVRKRDIVSLFLLSNSKIVVASALSMVSFVTGDFISQIFGVMVKFFIIFIILFIIVVIYHIAPFAIIISFYFSSHFCKTRSLNNISVFRSMRFGLFGLLVYGPLGVQTRKWNANRIPGREPVHIIQRV
jgi:hypothetical protein